MRQNLLYLSWAKPTAIYNILFYELADDYLENLEIRPLQSE
jgi:hypothetical protein